MLADAAAAVMSDEVDVGGKTMLIALELRELYRALYNACAKAYPAKAAHYSELATKRDNRELNDEFSQMMLSELPSLLGLK
jgi:hypothetical protein